MEPVLHNPPKGFGSSSVAGDCDLSFAHLPRGKIAFSASMNVWLLQATVQPPEGDVKRIRHAKLAQGSSNDALFFVGIAYLFVGFIDLIHTLAYYDVVPGERIYVKRESRVANDE